MRKVQSFHQDCVTLAFEKFWRGVVCNRTLLAGLAALVATPLLGGEASAQAARQLVMVDWGGSVNQGFGQFHGDPFTAANAGVRVVQDSRKEAGLQISDHIALTVQASAEMATALSAHIQYISSETLANTLSFGAATSAMYSGKAVLGDEEIVVAIDKI